jgi:hypothetical protein
MEKKLSTTNKAHSSKLWVVGSSPTGITRFSRFSMTRILGLLNQTISLFVCFYPEFRLIH